jgi:hypothetical protein
VSDDTNRVYIVSANENYNGPSVGLVLTWDGDEYSYGAVLFSPLSTIWSLEDSSVIDAVWITSKFTLPADAYEANEGASGICTIDYVPITNSVQLLTAADVAALGYIRAADATNICNYLLPAAGCTANGTGATITMGSGSPPPIAYQAAPSGALAVSMDANAPRNRWYSLTTIGKAASSWPSGALVSTNTSGTSPFYYAIGPYTGTLWQVVGGGR